MIESRHLRIRITAGGKPAGGVSVLLYRVPEAGRRSAAVELPTTDLEGWTTAPIRPGRRYVLRIVDAPEGYADVGLAHLDGRTHPPLVIELEPGADLRGRVRAVFEGHLDVRTIGLSRISTPQDRGIDVSGGNANVRVDADGNFLRRRLAFGTYRISLFRRGMGVAAVHPNEFRVEFTGQFVELRVNRGDDGPDAGVASR